MEYEYINKRKVFTRDQWRCGICHRKVNPALTYPHPQSASLDHVVPLSQGGGHTYANVQLAHWRCNIDKGVEGQPQQLALFG